MGKSKEAKRGGSLHIERRWRYPSFFLFYTLLTFLFSTATPSQPQPHPFLTHPSPTILGSTSPPPPLTQKLYLHTHTHRLRISTIVKIYNYHSYTNIGRYSKHQHTYYLETRQAHWEVAGSVRNTRLIGHFITGRLSLSLSLSLCVWLVARRISTSWQFGREKNRLSDWLSWPILTISLQFHNRTHRNRLASWHRRREPRTWLPDYLTTWETFICSSLYSSAYKSSIIS